MGAVEPQAWARQLCGLCAFRLVLVLLPTERGFVHQSALRDREYRHTLVILAAGIRIVLAAARAGLCMNFLLQDSGLPCHTKPAPTGQHILD
jgi:hypothetical protein